MLENLCIAGISFSLIRLTINQILLYQGWASSSFCSIFLNLSIAMYCVSIHPVYLFLWMRQVKYELTSIKFLKLPSSVVFVVFKYPFA